MPHPEADVSRGDALAFNKREDAPKSVHKHRDGNARHVSQRGLTGAPDSAHEISGSSETAPQRRLEVEFISEPEGGLGPYEVFVTSPQLQNEIGTGLIDTGAQVSLVRESSLRKSIPKEKYRDINVNIRGINGSDMLIRKGIMLQVNDSKEMLFYIVDRLPRNLNLILGQEWLLQNGYMMTCSKVVPPFSESVIKVPTKEKGIRLVDKQELLPGVYCGTSLGMCHEGYFSCLIVNMTSFPITQLPLPRLEKPPTFKLDGKNSKSVDDVERILKLNEKLRLDHITEGAETIRAICKEYVDIFKLPGDKLTAVSATAHSIPTPSVPEGRAITLKNYRLAEAHTREVNEQIQQMIRDEIIVPSQSEWNFPLIVVPKKLDPTGKRKWRICVDFRKLNEVSIGDTFPLPNIQDILDKVGRARYFSALDCASGFHQIPLKKEDRCKTAFSTPSGHFEYLRMPFGLKAAPATFQRMMNSILRDSIGDRCFVYVDDVLILGETLPEHHAKLREVFEQFRKFNVKIEPDKCEFLRPELTYLGHVISKEGVKPDPKKIEAVVRFPAPEKQKDVKAFLGLTGYYRKFIPHYSTIAKPLTTLLTKETPWKWNSEEQESFDLLKAKLVEFPILQYPDFQQPFLLTTDASGYGLGAVLSQGAVGKDKPIAYASRTLNSAELNYSTVEKECLAIVWACKHFRPYLLGRKFQILTDHRGLTWIFRVKDPSSRLLRWKLLLEEFDYEIKYKPGKQNTNADSLSRYPVMAIEAEELTPDRKARIIKEMHSDPVGGHQGINRTVDRIKLYTSWSNMAEDVANYIKTCEICQKMKHSKENRCQLQITDTQAEPWKKLHLDIVGPLPCTEEGHKYILTCQDNLSKYLIAEPLINQTVEEVSEALVHRVFLVYGIPGIILTDQGSNFMSEAFKEICKLFRIEKLNTVAYHPESNGALERSHKTLITYLRSYVDSKPSNWNQWLHFACFMFNTTPHSITQYSPYELLFGRKCNLPGELEQKIQPLYNYDDIVKVIRHRLQESHHIAQRNLMKFKEHQHVKTQSKEVSKDIKLNDLILVKKEQRKHKLEPIWEGPYEVKELKYPNLVIQRVGKRKREKVHMNQIKMFHCSQENQDEVTSSLDFE
ncbi:hypothetical protein B7P43_G08901 [Cryptotermes secundus]|uniref:RNA-directed DNA polymerase n=1 Tax=Cryptotermes secundus TaxID=105785 RepID=A0A2J7QTC1_9NEOP|nr:hypothetical protein B7P43_G08901 [Cryptotermes secundus]